MIQSPAPLRERDGSSTRRALLGVSASIVLAGCLHEPASPGMAFSYASPQAPLIVAEGRLGEGRAPAAIVLDTGGTAPYAAFIDTAVAKRLQLVLSDEIVPAASTAVGSGQRTYRTAVLPRFELGPVVLHNVEVGVADWIAAMVPTANRKVDAIVGYHFLQGRLFSIDYVGRRLDLAAAPGAAADAIPFTLGPLNPLLLVQAYVNGAGPFMMEIDTGATTTILSPAAAHRAGVVARSSAATISGASGAVPASIGAGRVAFGGLERDMGQLVVMAALDTIAAAAGTPIDGIIGTDFLYGSRLTVDYPRRRLWLSASRIAQ